jgi:DNA-directed RNA polymerase specialized sigma24 family protein
MSPAESSPDSVPEGSVTGWVRLTKQGDDDAAQKLWERYFQRIVQLAHRRIEGFSAAFDAEDVALSTFDQVIRAMREERLETLADRCDLWQILRINAMRRASDRFRTEGAAKRGGGRAASETHRQARRINVDLDRLPSRFDDPQFTSMMSEECLRLLTALQDNELEQVAKWKLEGLTNDQIAADLGYSRRTVQRMLQNIRAIWNRDKDSDGVDTPATVS